MSSPKNLSIPEHRDVSELLRIAHSVPPHKDSELIGELAVPPHEQPRMLLGRFDSDSNLEGFALELTPSSGADDAIVGRITALKRGTSYDLILHIANYGSDTVRAKIWQESSPEP